MADQEQVKAETQDAAHVEPAVTIGHDANGQFCVIGHGMDALKTLALLEHAKMHVLGNINPNRPRQVIPVAGRIPELNGQRRH